MLSVNQVLVSTLTGVVVSFLLPLFGWLHKRFNLPLEPYALPNWGTMVYVWAVSGIVAVLYVVATGGFNGLTFVSAWGVIFATTQLVHNTVNNILVPGQPPSPPGGPIAPKP